MIRSIRRSTTCETRKLSSLQTMKPTRRESEKENTLHTLSDHDLSEEHLTSVGWAVEKDLSETVKSVNLRDTISDISHLTEEALDVMMTPGPGDGNSSEDSCMGVMMHILMDYIVSEKYNLEYFEIHFRQSVARSHSRPIFGEGEQSAVENR